MRGKLYPLLSELRGKNNFTDMVLYSYNRIFTVVRNGVAGVVPLPDRCRMCVLPSMCWMPVFMAVAGNGKCSNFVAGCYCSTIIFIKQWPLAWMT